MRFESTRSMKQSVHYLWVGQPAEKLDNGIAGHDVIGPVSMVHHIDHDKTQLYFWCLREHFDHYQHKFARLPIIVCDIETLLETHKTRNSGQVSGKTVLAIFQSLLNQAKGRGRIRDFVTCKELFSLFLLAVKGGYVLDTSVVPAPDVATIHFPAYDKFALPFIKTKEGTQIEVWMMYSPAPDRSNYVEDALKKFVETWKAAEHFYRSTNSYNSIYLAKIQVVICASVLCVDDGIYVAKRDSAYVKIWQTKEVTGDEFDVRSYRLMTGPLVVKYYGNTHRSIEGQFLERQIAIIKAYLRYFNLLVQYDHKLSDPTHQKKFAAFLRFFSAIVAQQAIQLQSLLTRNAISIEQIERPRFTQQELMQIAGFEELVSICDNPSLLFASAASSTLSTESENTVFVVEKSSGIVTAPSS